MQRIIITLMNMYDAAPDLLDLLQLPAIINRDDFIGQLMIDIGESEVCITNPRIMKTAIGCWSRGRLPVWERLAAVQSTEYNPIWNVDGVVDHSGQTSGKRSVNRSGSESETSGTDRQWNETDATTGYISADNVETWSNDTKSDTTKDGAETIDETRNRNTSGTDTENTTGADSWTERRTGNIGVTTTQKMLTEEVEFWESYDIIKYIINQFAHEFCLLVY